MDRRDKLREITKINWTPEEKDVFNTVFKAIDMVSYVCEKTGSVDKVRVILQAKEELNIIVTGIAMQEMLKDTLN